MTAPPKAADSNASEERGSLVGLFATERDILAKRGSYILFYTSSGPALIEIGGKAVHLDTPPMAIIDIPTTGRVTLTCVDGNINLDRMELR